MTKKKTFILITLIALTSLGFYKYYSKATLTKPEAVWVETSMVKETTLPLEIHATGTLVARSVEITPEVAGHVNKIYFKDGTEVDQGSLLIQLDDALYQAQYQSAKAQLVYSENDYKRKTLLGKLGAISKQAIELAKADLTEKRAIADEKEVMLNKMKLTAPFTGVVGKSGVNSGDYVTMGKSMVTLTETKYLRIEYNVSEKYLPLLKRGQKVKITALAYPKKVFTGKVSFISPTINVENRSVSLYADIVNDDQLLAAGMFVNATQALGSEERTIMIPARSLVPIIDGEQVYKIVDGKAYPVTILIGRRVGNNVQVLQGLAVGDAVITDGQHKVKNGMVVKIKS